MKHILVLLGVTVCMVASLSAQSNASSSPGSADSPRRHAKVQPHAAAASVPKRPRIVYYITNRDVTGSHIPLVICRYDGDDFPMYGVSPRRVYGRESIDLSGSLNVGGALAALDPAITVH